MGDVIMADEHELLDEPLFKLGVDSKYGEVYVSKPPAKMKAHYESGEKLPDGVGTEPLFILRGTDACTPDTIDCWIDNNHERLNPAMDAINSASSRMNEIEQWQEAHKDLVKLAD